jgi:hypothetical protein
MAIGDTLSDDENVIRALYVPHWDVANNRICSSAFREQEVSVSRTSILNYDKIIEIFKSDLEQPLNNGAIRKIHATAELNVGDIHSLNNDNTNPVKLKVIEDPTDENVNLCKNIAHALIQGMDKNNQPKAMSKGMSNKLIKFCCVNSL